MRSDDTQTLTESCAQLHTAVAMLKDTLADMEMRQDAFRETSGSMRFRSVPPSRHKSVERYRAKSARGLRNVAFDSNIEDDHGDHDFDRKQIRIDGLEVYAVVSALTFATIVAVFDSFPLQDPNQQFRDGKYVEALMGITFITAGVIGIVNGLHTISIFSLVTMYGRTALGMNRDIALEKFFAGTVEHRYRGFKSFLRSLYALMVELVVLVISKVPEPNRPIMLLVSCALMFTVLRDANNIVEKAGIIYQSPLSSSEEDDDDSDLQSLMDTSQISMMSTPETEKTTGTLSAAYTVVDSVADTVVSTVDVAKRDSDRPSLNKIMDRPCFTSNCHNMPRRRPSLRSTLTLRNLNSTLSLRNLKKSKKRPGRASSSEVGQNADAGMPIALNGKGSSV